MLNDKLLTAITAILFVTGLSCIGYVLYKKFSDYGAQEKVAENQGCVKQTLSKSMADDWMEGLISKGQNYTVKKGYYSCNPIRRGELVWFRVSPPIEPVVRIVRAIPGDNFTVEQDPKNGKHWIVKINGKEVDSEKGPYFIRSGHTPPLKTYEISRKGRLRDGEYIIFSNTPPGQSDSGNLGLVRKRSFEGKVTL